MMCGVCRLIVKLLVQHGYTCVNTKLYKKTLFDIGSETQGFWVAVMDLHICDIIYDNYNIVPHRISYSPVDENYFADYLWEDVVEVLYDKLMEGKE